ncbi:MAG: hypothetical protein ACT4N4_15935 [Rhodospirillales bacterium]
MTDRKPLRIMVAGPYTSGAKDADGLAANLAAMNRAALEVWRRGHVPVIGVNMALPVIGVAGDQRFEEIMLPLSLALAERCDAVLRIGGPSSGADKEVDAIRKKGGQVFRDVAEIPPAR